MADSIRVSLPTSGEENDEAGSPDEAVPGTPGPGDAHRTEHRPQKRRRIPVACGACRSKKSRVRLVAVPQRGLCFMPARVLGGFEISQSSDGRILL